jgi:hypothetical protein
MYLSLFEAIEELERRQRNVALVEKVNNFLGNCPIPNGKMYGFLGRHIASARLEDLQFEKRCKEVGLDPLFLEYTEDIFYSINPSKTRLVRLYIFNGYGKRGGPNISRIDLLGTRNLNRFNGLPLSQIKTMYGESLISFHHRTRDFVGLKGNILDLSLWLKSIGPAKVYYTYYFAACITRGILFESFESFGFPDLEKFKQEVVIPAWNEVLKNFGVAPLIVYHPDVSSPEEETRILNWYPKEILQALSPR